MFYHILLQESGVVMDNNMDFSMHSPPPLNLDSDLDVGGEDNRSTRRRTRVQKFKTKTF